MVDGQGDLGINQAFYIRNNIAPLFLGCRYCDVTCNYRYYIKILVKQFSELDINKR